MFASSSSGFKNAKTGLDSTYMTTCAESSGFFNTKSRPVRKYALALSRAQESLDDIINIATQKRDLNEMGIRTVGDTNESIIDSLKENHYYPLVAEHMEDEDESIEVQKLIKMIQSKKQNNLHLAKRCNALEGENSHLKQSQLTNLPQNFMSSRVFEELENLKAENLALRRQAAILLGRNQ